MFVPAATGWNDGTTFGMSGANYTALTIFPNTGTPIWYFNVKVPAGATSISSIKLWYLQDAVQTGDVFVRFRCGMVNTDSTNVAASKDESDNGTAYTIGTASSNFDAVTINSASYSGLAAFDADDIIGFECYRNRGSASDTFEASWNVIGAVIVFA